MRKKKKALKQRPYNFDSDLEFAIYKQIGKEKKGRKAKAIEKQGIEIPNKYSTWKAGVIERYPKLIDNEDLFHFLRAEVRRSKGFHDLTVAVATPIEVAVLSILLSFLGPQHVSLLSIILLIFFLHGCFRLMCQKVELKLHILRTLSRSSARNMPIKAEMET